ncbi:proline reductase cluster protein PrdD [Tepidibacter thalassicus]|uniref:D-proline reductase (Dithiol) PrdD n=1 Tax=Tepidibacter thalassicus DSM 15285 TaxID=1123350 RepID=A0A1M5PJ71_9FIRM|nr:proline reductase cluster protein PrdD [Tepidibacter thalassicus]SHH01767.1 D-proline reductase (dithiol) PrdD [Tepidibacter thalassicus DSM 15285]
MDKERILRRLVIKSFHVDKVKFGDVNKFSNGVLVVDKEISNFLIEEDELISDIKIDIISPGQYDKYVNTIMDIIPISTKVLGRIGEGITHTLTGVYVMLTGVDEDGRQMHEFGSSEGILKDKLKFGMPGTPSENDYIIHFDVVLKGNQPFERKLPLAAFRACDKFIQNFRNVLKQMDGRDATESHEFFDKMRPNCKKVLIIKQIAGQGAMYDNQLFSDEPSGLNGGISIIDIKNVPMIISPNEYRDGALRAMT